MKSLYRYVTEVLEVKTPIRLEIGLDKFSANPKRQGNERRYLRAFINGHEVTEMVAAVAGLCLSMEQVWI